MREKKEREIISKRGSRQGEKEREIKSQRIRESQRKINSGRVEDYK